MPHAVQVANMSIVPRKLSQYSNHKPLPRELLQLSRQLLGLQDLYSKSQLSKSIEQQLQRILKCGRPFTCIVSLGLGSLLVANGQSRRLKQLAILLAMKEYFLDRRQELVEIYAQDPAFTSKDETLLMSFGIQILRTPLGSELGEARSVMSPTMLVYSPFLTLEAYEQLFLRSTATVQCLIGDDFNSLLQKWPKRSVERKQVEDIVRQGLAGYRRKASVGEGFWTPEDETFPMAIYVKTIEETQMVLRPKM